jgi:hypothetical protein
MQPKQKKVLGKMNFVSVSSCINLVIIMIQIYDRCIEMSLNVD